MTAERKNPRSPGAVNQLLFNREGKATGDGDCTFDGTKLTATEAVFTDKVGFYTTTPVTQPAAIANLAASSTLNSLPTASGSIVVNDGQDPTAYEVLRYCVELHAKVSGVMSSLRTLGLIDT